MPAAGRACDYLAKVDDIESAEYAKVEKEIADVSSKTKNMDANLKKFEAAEEKVKKKYKL